MKSLLSKYKSLDRKRAEEEGDGEDDQSLKRSKTASDQSKKKEQQVKVDFLIIGAQKAGTTALAKNLNKHPDVFVKNECQFFTFCWGFGPSWYREQLKTTKTLVGEKTPELIYCDDCAPRIKEICPEAKFILCLRDPINRAYSSWNMEIRTNKESLTFEECIERELESQMGAKRTYGTAEYHYIQRGFYMDQIERFMKVFPDRSRLLIVIAERLLSNPTEEYSRIISFLGTSNFSFVPEKDNVGDYSDKISEKAFKKLLDIYTPHNKRLFDFLGYSIPEWASQDGRSTVSLTPDESKVYSSSQVIETTAATTELRGSENNIAPLTSVGNPLTSHDGDFAQIGNRTGTDKIFHHGYHRYYPLYLDRMRVITGGGMLEVGVEESKSLKLWLEYFPNAFIYGIDIGVCKQGPRFKIMQADQSKTEELRELVNHEIKHPLFFIIDDGSHIPEHQLSTFDYFFGEVLLPGGVYIIEDIETSYWTRNGLYGYDTRYGYHHKRSIVEVFKDLLDEIQSEFLNRRARESQDRCLRGIISRRTRNDINSIAFGQNCIIITKKTEAEHKEFDDRRYRFGMNL